MAYTAPTAADLKARFPAFAAVDDAVIDGALTEAVRRVDETWPEEDFATGRLLYAAHVLAMDGHGAGVEAEAMAEGAGLYKRRKAGGSEIEFADGVAGSGAVSGELGSTSYGRRFKALARALFAGPRVT